MSVVCNTFLHKGQWACILLFLIGWLRARREKQQRAGARSVEQVNKPIGSLLSTTLQGGNN